MPTDGQDTGADSASAPGPEAQAEAATEALPDGLEPGFDAEIEALINERDELKDRLLRSLAETENVRKRAERDRREGEAYGATRLARDLLPVYDSLRRALDTADEAHREHAGALLEGVELTMRELLNIFQRHRITRISPEPGAPFDPQLHQAMFEAPLPGATPGTVIQVMTDGFLLHDRLLRPAQVGVASAAQGAAQG
ncbi:MAG: nucleotide exchange factor GrpE [Rhodobacteraceae bacterium]|nr:nucleotide exchange factor GrpE [Paracoccaceae bacterium]